MAKTKKQLFRVKLLASEEFGNKEISDTFCSDYSYLVNRRFCLNLTEVTQSNKYHYKVWFRITKVDNGIAHSRFDGIESLREYIQSHVYVGIKRMNVYVNVKTKDNALLRVKYILTFRRLRGKQEKTIRKIVEENTIKLLSQMTLKEIIEDMILKNNVLKKIEKEVKKIAIPKFFEIIKIERKDKIAS
ncbi:MAG: hypothetical protein QW197_00955 [Candidatus Aenigmatarchaeota archaeon]